MREKPGLSVMILPRITMVPREEMTMAMPSRVAVVVVVVVEVEVEVGP